MTSIQISLSQSRSLEEMADFWDTHDATDFDTQTHEVKMEFDLKASRHYIAIDPDVLTEVREATTARVLSKGDSAGCLGTAAGKG